MIHGFVPGITGEIDKSADTWKQRLKIVCGISRISVVHNHVSKDIDFQVKIFQK